MIFWKTKSAGKTKGAIISILLIGLVTSLIVWPLISARNAEFRGTDDQVKGAIQEINADYKPWFASIYKPPSAEIESMFFAIQAAIGAGIIGFGLGYLKGSKKKEDKEPL